MIRLGILLLGAMLFGGTVQAQEVSPLVKYGKWVLVANQNSNEVVVLPFGGGHDPLGEPVARAAVKAPAVIHFAPNNG